MSNCILHIFNIFCMFIPYYFLVLILVIFSHGLISGHTNFPINFFLFNENLLFANPLLYGSNKRRLQVKSLKIFDCAFFSFILKKNFKN